VSGATYNLPAGANMKIRLVLFGIALSAFAASLFCLFQATAIAQPYSPTYPTPYTGPMTVTTPYSISLGDTGDTFSFTVPSANIQNGELQGTSIFVNSTEMGSYSGAWPPGINRAGVAAPYQINMPTFGFSQTSGAGVADAERPCCDSSSTQSFSFTIVPQSGPFHGNTFITYPSQIPTSGPQVMPNPSSYKPPLGGSGTVTVQSVLNTLPHFLCSPPASAA
jgi:hypothetical protein